jgi:hypothetical protein
MTHPLHDVFAMHVRIARESEPTLDPVPVLEALGHVLLLEATGLRELVSEADRDVLLALGETAVRRARWMRNESLAEDDLDFIEEALPLAEAGLALLGGESIDASRLPRELLDPGPARVVAALRGDLGGFEAGRLAARFLRLGDGSLRAAHEMRERVFATERSSRKLAAAAAAHIRDPREGERVFVDDAMGVEVVLFDDDATLAAYAEHDYVSLAGAHIASVTHQTGFCLARLAEGAKGALTISVTVGDEEVTCEVTV